MRRSCIGAITHLAGVCLALANRNLPAATLYVAPDSPNPSPPYAAWATAAHVIQDAVDAAAADDQIVVTNGVYATGGRAVDGTMTNRVAVTKAVRLLSVNGPAVTLIQGAKAPGGGNGDGAVRCVYLACGAVVSGFTLTNGATRSDWEDWKEGVLGGGVWCKEWCGSVDAAVSNCVVAGNSALEGGGAYGCTLNNCTLSRNSAVSGGGAGRCTLNNCTLTGNSATFGGGACGCTLNNCTLEANDGGWGGGVWNSALTNCILYFNTGGIGLGSNYGNDTLSYCCTSPLPPGPGNLDADPRFVDAASGDYHLRADSPCIDAGANLWSLITADLEGRPRPVDGDNDGFARFDMGAHEFQGTEPLIRVHLVSGDSAHPVPPYGSWATAARTVQEAIDLAAAGDEVVVTNGVYASGGRVAVGALTNRVVVDRPLTVRSVNGPQFTVIQGYQVPGTTNGDGAIRCVYLASGAVLSGFTLTNGATRSGGNAPQEHGGGGIWCESASAVVSNCVAAGNSARGVGGGAATGTIYNSTLTGNSAGAGGGVAGGTLYNCTLSDNKADEYGGGAYYATLYRCTLADNSARSGGGVYDGTNYSCLLMGNVGSAGGGARSAALYDCTLVGNRATEQGGGVHDGTLRNCIVCSNQAPTGPNWYSEEPWPIAAEFSCTTPPLAGAGNLDSDPRFQDAANGDLRLQPDSPCINAGRNSDVTSPTDLDGLPRIVGGTVDLGAYEFQAPSSTISYAWLQQYGLPTDGSADTTDPDADGLNTWQEWRCLTDPTNTLSVLRLLSAVPIGAHVRVTWPGFEGVRYSLERCTAFGATPPFTPRARNLPGTTGTNGFTDTNASVLPGGFYRVGVEE